MKGFITVAATWFGTGFSPLASGTVGTLGAIPFYLVLAGMHPALYILTTAAFTLFACWTAGQAEHVFGEHDSGKIVIDEVAGYLVTMVGVPLSWQTVAAGFFLFRFFDVTKPQPARWFDSSVQNGYGVVLDDVVAGLYSCAVIHLVMRFV